MIRAADHPVEWALFLAELEDAREHLSTLVDDLVREGQVHRGSFSVDLGHVYSHLNRAWHRHEHVGDLAEEEWTTASAFPTDLRPT